MSDYHGTSGDDILDQAGLGLADGSVIYSGGGDDIVLVTNGTVVGEAGNDIIVGHSAGSAAGYWTSPAAVSVDLQAGLADDGFGTVDVLKSIHSVTGSSYADTLLGGSASDSFTGGAGNDSIDGGAGIDTAVSTGIRSHFTLSKTSTGFSLADTVAAEGIDTLTRIERIKFADAGIALDVGATQAAGQTVLLLGAVLPGSLVFDASKQALLGAAIDLFDQGYSLQTLSGAVTRLPIWDILTGKATPTTTDIASYLLTNVNGVAPDATTLATAVAALASETDFATQGNFLWHLAESAAGQSHVGLVGLAATGLAYI